MLYPFEKEFIKLTAQGNLIPVVRELPADLETPVSAYLKLSKGSKYSFLLESVEGEERIARFSFVARDPEMIIRCAADQIEITDLSGPKKKVRKESHGGDPLRYVRDIFKFYRFVNVPGLPSFCGGFVGYLGYDTVKYFERLPHKTKKDVDLPEILLILAKDLVIFDHKNHKLKIVSCTLVEPKASAKAKSAAYRAALRRIESILADLKKPLKLPYNNVGQKTAQPVKLRLSSNFKRKDFEAIVEKAKEDIRAGEIIQVVLSQRFETKLDIDPIHVYRSLRAINPSPYMYYLNFGDIRIAGASPEPLVRCEQGVVETRPIAGTRKRGKTDEEDAALVKDLLSDPKERAEHVMLVDLGRNDLGRVCKEGSVHVSEFMKIEKYSHVMHIVSNVKGQLAEGKDGFDVLKAAFPAGTVSGAPKIRAMEIIEDLEKVSRGPYAGCIGYFSFSGDVDTCITIRTIVIKNKKAYIQAGAGIVADSKADKEFEETCNKARAQIRAIELAHNLK